MAAIAIAQDQTTGQFAVRECRLQHALQRRIVIEQARGINSVRSRVDMDDAFNRFRSYLRNNNQRLTDVAEDVIAGSTIVGSDETVRSAWPPPDNPPPSS